MLRIELKPASKGPGYGNLELKGWKHSDIDLEVSVLRNQDERYLGADGTWTSTQAWHSANTLSKNDDLLSGEVGPWLIDPLLQSAQSQYMLELRQGDNSDKGVVRVTGNILSSEAAGNSNHQPAPVISADPDEEFKGAPDVEQVVSEKPDISQVIEPEPGLEAPEITEPVPPPTPVPEPKTKWWLKWWLWLLILLAIIGIAALAYFFLYKAEGATPTNETGTTTTATIDDCSVEAMAQTGELGFIQTCLKTSPDSQQILTIINAAKKHGHCGVMQRLYAFKAQGGDPDVALAYAKEFDPKFYKSGGCISESDTETAVYWYEIVLENQSDDKLAIERLAELKP